MSKKLKVTKHIKTKETSLLVRTLALSGVTQEVCARAMDISTDTIQRHYREEWTEGATIATAKVAANLYKHAISNDPRCLAAAIFWMKTRGGWRENHTIDANITAPVLQFVAASAVPEPPPALTKTLQDLSE